MNNSDTFLQIICIIMSYFVERDEIMKYIRQREKISQEDLSRQSGISQSQIAKLESKRYAHSPTIRTVVSLSKALKVCPYRLSEYFVSKEVTGCHNCEHYIKRSDIEKCAQFNIIKITKF